MKAFYLSALATLLLTACAQHTHLLVVDTEAAYLAGELVHDQGKGNRLVLETPNRRYEARGFTVERGTDLAGLRKQYYGAEPRHWERITAGLDTDHSAFSAQVVARSSDSFELSCRLNWTATTKPAGICTAQDGKAFPVRFE